MPSEYCLMHVGYWVTDLGAISCLGAGLAALVLTLLPGKKLTGKTEGADPSSFIDPGAGETARYRLAYKDLVTVKNSGQDVTQVSGQVPDADGGSAVEGTRAMSASELAITMFDQGVLGIGLGERSLEATKSFSKTKVEKTKVDSKTKIEKKKIDSKTQIEPKPKEEKPKAEKSKPDKKAPKKDAKKDSKKEEEKKDLQLNMAVRKITYGSKKTDQSVSKPGFEEPDEQKSGQVSDEETPDPLKPTYFTSEILDAMDRQPASFLNQPSEPSEPAPGLPMQASQYPPQGFPAPPDSVPTSPSQRVPLPPHQPPPTGFPAPTNPTPGFPMPASQPPAQGFPVQPDAAPGFPAPTNPTPGFPMSANQPSQPPAQPPARPEPQPPQQPPQQPQTQPEEIDPTKDPKKVGRSTLIEPKSNLQKDREPPPPEYFK